MISLRPGTYEIGMEDGSIEPVLIVVGRAHEVVACTPNTFDTFCQAVNGVDGPWWFRWVEVPEVLPISMDGWEIPLPPPPLT